MPRGRRIRVHIIMCRKNRVAVLPRLGRGDTNTKQNTSIGQRVEKKHTIEQHYDSRINSAYRFLDVIYVRSYTHRYIAYIYIYTLRLRVDNRNGFHTHSNNNITYTFIVYLLLYLFTNGHVTQNFVHDFPHYPFRPYPPVVPSNIHVSLSLYIYSNLSPKLL